MNTLGLLQIQVKIHYHVQMSQPLAPIPFETNLVQSLASKYEYVRNNTRIFVYSHKTQLCAIKYVYYTYYNDIFRPSTAIIRLYMKTSSIYTIYHRSSVWMEWIGGYFARSRLGLGCADQLACFRV